MRLVMPGLATLLIAFAPLLSAQNATNFHRSSPLFIVGPKPISIGVPGASVFSCQVPGAAVPCYDPAQIRRAYKIQALLDEGFTGAGKTIVIIDAFQSPTITQDLKVFNTVFGLPPIPTFTQIAPDGLTPFDPANADEVGWSGEISLDVEWSHAIAPGANIVLVLAKSDADADLLSATKYAVDHRLGDVISQSFGEDESCSADNSQVHKVFVEATLKSMTIFASSADDGASLPSCDGTTFLKGVSVPAADPLVVGVGGTTLSAAPYCDTCGKPGTYEGEVVWNDEFGASGGGYSVLFKKPFYQSLAVKGDRRGVPDVAYNGDVSGGVLTAWSQGVAANVGQIFIFGGTSAGSPQWAALTALADQRAGYDIGFINQGLYLMGLDKPIYSSSFHDITSGNNSVSGIDSNGNPFSVIGYNAGPGWDPTTGLGSPRGIYFVDNLSKFVSPLDGLIGIVESGPLSAAFASKPGRMHPH